LPCLTLFVDSVNRNSLGLPAVTVTLDEAAVAWTDAEAGTATANVLSDNAARAAALRLLIDPLLRGRR
jgi:hypothetical protein